jgi:uncharacterized membrane protein YgdD (TMEM256/DUF423 family)
MNNTRSGGWAFVAGFLLMTASALGHHGDAGRYEEKLTTVKGTVVQVQLANPHSMLILEVKDENGKAVRWQGELGSPAQLKRLGWVTGAIKVGDTVTMRGRRLKNGSPYLTLSECARVFDANGKELFRGNDPGRPATEPGAPAAKGDPCAGPIK